MFKKLLGGKKSSEQLTLSTALTLIRILLIPEIVGCILYACWDTAACLFIFAALTDVLDGAFARLFDEETLLGTYLDPIADKLLVLASYGALVWVSVPYVALPGWLLCFLLLKELLLMAGGVGLLVTDEATVVQPTWLGKGTMLLQTMSIFWFLLTLYTGQITVQVNTLIHFLIFCSNALSLGHYLYKGLKGTRLWYLLKRSFYFSS